MNINVKSIDRGTFLLTEWGEWVCAHEDVYIEPACCNGIDSEGNTDCGCYGRDQLICPNMLCTGVEDYEIDRLFEACYAN